MINFLNSWMQQVLSGKNQSLRFRVSRALFWSVTGSVFSRIFSLMAILSIGRILGSDVWGEFSVIQNFLLLIGTTLGAAFLVSTSHLVSENRSINLNKSKNLAVASFCVSAIIGIALFVILISLSPIISVRILKSSSIQDEFKIGAIFVLFSCLNGMAFGVINGAEEFKLSSLLTIVNSVFLFLFSIIGPKYFLLRGAVLSFVLTEALTFPINLYFAIKSLGIYTVSNIDLKPSDWRLTLQTVIPAIASRFLIIPSVWVSNLILIYYSTGFNEIGLYNAADKLKQIILFIPSALSTMMLPIMSNLYNTKQSEKFILLLKANIGINLVVSVPIIFIFGYFSPFVMALFGNNFISGSNTLVFISIASFPMILNTFLGQVLISVGLIWKRMLVDGKNKPRCGCVASLQ